MARLIIFLLSFLLVGWIFAYSMSGKNQKRALLGVGKIVALIVVGALVISLLVTF